MTANLRKHAGVAIVLLLLSAFAVAQEQKEAPLAADEVVALVESVKAGQLSATRAVEVIEERGVNFVVSEMYVLELTVRGADELILETLRNLRDIDKKFPLTGEKGSEAPDEGNPPSQAGRAPSAAEWPEFLEAVRAKALSYADDLPNFICTQVTKRFVGRFPAGWQTTDSFAADVSYFDKQEHYKIISVSNHPAPNKTMDDLGGATSFGEFGSRLNSIFDPRRNASFHLEGSEKISGHDTVRVSYLVPLETSDYSIGYSDKLGNPLKSIITAYQGRCWVDPASYNVIRVEERAFNIPIGFPVTRAENIIEYDLADIAGKKYWLPIRAEMMMVEGANKVQVRNTIEFKLYRKFEAEVKLVSDSTQ